MSEITLEKVDIIRERTGVSYSEAKEALEVSDGDVVEALVYLENKDKKSGNEFVHELYTTKDEFVKWLKDTVNKGNVSRVKIKKDDKVLIDIPVNAGLAAGFFAILWPQILALGILTAVITRVTVEITKDDGSVEVVNTIIKNAVNDMKNKVNDIKTDVEEKVNKKTSDEEETIYQYSVTFDDVDDTENEKNDIENEIQNEENSEMSKQEEVNVDSEVNEEKEE